MTHIQLNPIKTAWLCFETALFGLALGFLMPPFPSDETTIYQFGWMPVLIFTLNRGMSVARRGETMISAFAQVLIDWLVGTLIFDRVQ